MPRNKTNSNHPTAKTSQLSFDAANVNYEKK